MKKILILLALVLVITPFLQAQVAISEGTAAMSQGTNNGFTMKVEGLDASTVEKLWSKHIKDYKGKEQKVKKSDEMLADDAEINGVSDNTVDVYSLVTKSAEGAQITVWFDLGGAYLSSKTHPDRYPAANQLLQDFSRVLDEEKVNTLLEAQEDSLKEMEKDLADFQKEQKKLEEDIEKYKEKIAEAEAGVEEAVQNQRSKEAEIKEQNKLIETTKDRLKSLKKG